MACRHCNLSKQNASEVVGGGSGKGLTGMAGWGQAEKMYFENPQVGNSRIQPFLDLAKCSVSTYRATGPVPDTGNTAVTKTGGPWPHGADPVGRSMGNEHINK